MNLNFDCVLFDVVIRCRWSCNHLHRLLLAAGLVIAVLVFPVGMHQPFVCPSNHIGLLLKTKIKNNFISIIHMHACMCIITLPEWLAVAATVNQYIEFFGPIIGFFVFAKAQQKLDELAFCRFGLIKKQISNGALP